MLLGERLPHRPRVPTWNTSATGPEGEATRLPLIARGSLGARRFRSIRRAAHASLTGRTGLRAQPATVDVTTDPQAASEAVLERLTLRNPKTGRSRRSGASRRRPLYPWRQGSPAGCLGELGSPRPEAQQQSATESR